ncbi:MAG: helix-turn-helix domain-containing protein [Nannocystaceae bacterium]|nr:AraC family transcriptional regulator [bacterium]
MVEQFLERPVGAQRFTPRRCGRAGLAVHTYSAMGLVLEGKGAFEQSGRFRLQPGDVYLVPAGMRHRLLEVDELDAWGVRFNPPCFASTDVGRLFAPFDRARAGGSAVVSIPAARRPFLATLCSELAAETSDAIAQRSLLSLILTEVSRAAGVGAPAHVTGSLAGDALRFIERNCLGPISLADVAKAVHRSPAHVSSVVRRSTGTSVKGWIIAGRLAEASSRLMHSDDSVEAIADRVGYADPTHFIRLFRRTYGVTPAAWRSRVQGLPHP